MAEEARGGRRREYATDADRVRAWRQRQKDKARAQQQQDALPTDPTSAIGTLADAVPLLRRETQAMLETLTTIASSITTATDLLADPAAIDAQLRRVQAEADKVRADAAAEIAALQDELDTARTERADADAAATAADAEATEALAQLTAARAEHAAAQDRWQQQLDQAASAHREQIVGFEHRIELLTGQLDEHRERLTRAIAEKDAAAATAAEHTRRL
ncbi:hypothetical protein, partial [Rhodococcus pyridinivorans]|uniref:hypothetical protein n=1 Tax=Rhodococcus pyridinivorans TaxID=103816 RepID=UPI0007CD5CB1